MKQAYNILFLAFFLLNVQCKTQKFTANNQCATIYPVLLVHGIGLRDDIAIMKYWSKIPKNLKKYGAIVYLANQDAFNSHVENALLIRERVFQIMEETGSNKVNIIAHSKGGLESRYMITKLGMSNHVASLTTLASPHRGSAMADTIFSFLGKKNLLDKTVTIINKFAHLLGDKNPNTFHGGKDLTIEHMKHFNKSVPDVPTVYYQSYGGIISENYPAWHIRVQQKIMFKAEGENDGVVSKDSYQWGDFKGVVKGNDDFGISHFDIIGMRAVSQVSSFDANYFIIDIVKDLKSKGF